MPTIAVDRFPLQNRVHRATSDVPPAKEPSLEVTDVVLTKAEFSGLSGMQQMFKSNKSIGGSSSNDAD